MRKKEAGRRGRKRERAGTNLRVLATQRETSSVNRQNALETLLQPCRVFSCHWFGGLMLMLTLLTQLASAVGGGGAEQHWRHPEARKHHRRTRKH